MATFALGGLSVIPAGLAEWACGTATPWLDPSVMTFGGQSWALPIAVAVGVTIRGRAPLKHHGTLERVGLRPLQAHAFPSPLVEKISRVFGFIIRSAAVKAILDRPLI